MNPRSSAPWLGHSLCTQASREVAPLLGPVCKEEEEEARTRSDTPTPEGGVGVGVGVRRGIPNDKVNTNSYFATATLFSLYLFRLLPRWRLTTFHPRMYKSVALSIGVNHRGAKGPRSNPNAQNENGLIVSTHR